MISLVALALVANTYFIQTDYYSHRVAVDITAFCQSGQDFTIKPVNFGIAGYGDFIAIGNARTTLAKAIICKRPRDGVRYNHVQHDKTVYRI